MAEIFLFTLTHHQQPPLTNDFSPNHKHLYDICMHANSVLYCAYREKKLELKNRYFGVVLHHFITLRKNKPSI